MPPITNAFVLAAGGGGGFQLIGLDVEAVIWSWIIFGLLFLVLRKMAWPMITGAVERREDYIAESLRKAEEVQKATQEIQAKQEAMLAEAQAQAKSVLDEAREQADVYRRKEEERAKTDADAFLDRARKEIALEEAKARDTLRREVVDLTLQAAGQVLERSVGGDDERRLADQLVTELQQRQVGADRN